jgi:protein-S-isoprenylcysteine O-methyltransferase Ste14
MDPINIIAGLNLIATFGANLKGAKKSLKTTVGTSKEKPKTYLQKLPLTLAMVTLIGLILGIFQIGTIPYAKDNMTLRLIGLIFYLFFSWLQIWAYRTMGESYSQEIVILKNHKLVTSGPFKLIRHPQYLSQILMDLGAGIATLSYIVIPIAIIQIPFVILRANLEEKLLAKHLKNDFAEYKSKSGFMIPFIG